MLQERIRAAAERGTPLELRGGGTKGFFGNVPRGDVLDTRGHAGITDYESSELVVLPVVVTERDGRFVSDLAADRFAVFDNVGNPVNGPVPSILAVVEGLGEPKLATLDHRHFAAMRPRHFPALTLLPA